MLREKGEAQVTASYSLSRISCPCGCGGDGWLLHSGEWCAPRVMQAEAAGLALSLLSSGRLTEDELSVLWSVAEDNTEEVAH